MENTDTTQFFLSENRVFFARMGGDLRRFNQSSVDSGFNSRPRMGGDVLRQVAMYGETRFNSRPRMGGDLGEFVRTIDHELFQLTPPHGGRLPRTEVRGRYGVSTHAPAWGATTGTRLTRTRTEFQLTPPHGGRLPTMILVGSFRLFQLTPPHGGRRLHPRW